MNLFQLVLKQMRQRALSTWLTMLSVILGVGLAIAILILWRESEKLFGQTDYGYDVLIGAKGSPLQLVMNTVYHIDKSPGNIPYSMYEDMVRGQQYRPFVKIAVPFAVGDNYKGHRIVGTLPKLFGVDDEGQKLPPEKVLEYRPDKRFEIAQGAVFHAQKFEAVVGSEIPKLTGLTIGSKLKATHGLSTDEDDEHETEWTVVGILAPTHTANDRVLFIPLITFYAIEGHGDALEAIHKVKAGEDPSRIASPTTSPAAHKHEHEEEAEEDDVSAYFDEDEHESEEHPGHDDHAHHDHAHGGFTLNKDGTIDLDLPQDEWLISAILVESRGGIAGQNLMYAINNRDEAMAVSPAMTMREFFDNFLKNTTKILLVISLLVTIVAAVSILVSIYNSVSARMKEIAVLRALGATRRRILTLICVEAGLIGLIGGVLGFVGGHLVGAIQSYYFQQRLGQSINWVAADEWEGLYLLCVVVLAVLAGLVPALKAYRTPVATNLVAG